MTTLEEQRKAIAQAMRDLQRQILKLSGGNNPASTVIDEMRHEVECLIDAQNTIQRVKELREFISGE